MIIAIDKIRTEGNSLIIRMQPATNLLGLTSFTSTEIGVSSTSYFEKYFRFSLNGVVFNDYASLTPEAITSLQLSVLDILVVELKYVKVQPQNVDVLGVIAISIEANESSETPLYYFDKTIFKFFFNNDSVAVLSWQINVLKKLYERGIVPNYIDRVDDSNDPSDYITFWGTVSKFFSYYVTYAREFQNFNLNSSLLIEYLEERGIKTSIENGLEELNLILNRFYNQISYRGTIRIVDKKENGSSFDGELLRLIWYRELEDEFIFNVHKSEHFGWNLRNSSPLYRSLCLSDNANKYGDQNFIPQDISKYSGATLIQDQDQNVLRVLSALESVPNKIKVSSNLDYEFSFLIKKEFAATLTVRLEGRDKDLNQIELNSHKSGLAKNDFFTNINLSRDDKYLSIRLYLYNRFKALDNSDSTNIHQGENLNLVDKVVWITPIIELQGGAANIYGVRFLPVNTPYSHGLIQTNNFISCFLKNRNNSLKSREIDLFIKKYLICYNNNLSIIDIDKQLSI